MANKDPNYGPNDFPLAEIIPAVQEAIRHGCTVYQKYTCRGCNRRLQGNTPNMIAENGHCEHCGAITDLKKHGCNYVLVGRTLQAQKYMLSNYVGQGTLTQVPRDRGNPSGRPH